MELTVLAIGDVFSPAGLEFLVRHLRSAKKLYGVDFCVVNGENASILGVTPEQSEKMLDAGADVITLGNHAVSQREIVPYLDEQPRILRPANYAPQQPGRGWGVYETNAGPVTVINLIGRCFMNYGPDNPFLLMDKLLKNRKSKAVLVDFHAEATSEKLAMGYMLDGKVSAVWGTHTHVPTADCQILPKGAGFISDLGHTGPLHSVLGVRPEQSIASFRGDLTSRYREAPGPCRMAGAIFTIDMETGLCTRAERMEIRD